MSDCTSMSEHNYGFFQCDDHLTFSLAILTAKSQMILIVC